LDIGCGSGNLLNSISKTKFIFGIDKSADMINLANKKTNATLLQNDVIKDPLNYDNNYFDIITCTNNTIYEIDNKVLLLRYCFNWLKRGGILALHLVDPDNFNMVVPISDYYDKINELTDNRIYETELDFSDYTYKNNFVKQLDQIYIQKEEFVDKYSNHLRQYEKQIYFENINSILTIAKNIGFKIFKKENTINNLGDKHQYFVILFKPLSGEI
jgi:SAM-dependent methyltransferase